MSYIPQIYSQSFIEQMETLLPENYTMNKYYQSINNNDQYIMRNSKGYFHIISWKLSEQRMVLLLFTTELTKMQL